MEATGAEAYLEGMTTYTPPHFATGLPERHVRSALDKETNRNARAPYGTQELRTGSGSAAARDLRGAPIALDPSDVRTADWQPAAGSGVPKAAIGALGVALIGGVALAIVLMAPSKVTKAVNADPFAVAATQNGATAPAAASTSSTSAATGGFDAAVSSVNDQAPAAGPATLAPDTASATTEQRAADATAAARAAAQPAVTTSAAPVVAPSAIQATRTTAAPTRSAPVARVVHDTKASTTSLTPPPVLPDAPATPPAENEPAVPTPAMQQIPDVPTVTPSLPQPAPASPDTGSTPAPTDRQ